MSQDEWCNKVTDVIKEYTDRPIKFRNKPRLVINGGKLVLQMI